MGELMTVDDIAKLYRCSRRHARDVIVKTNGFPKPVPGTAGKHRRWLADEVMRFTRSQERMH